MKWVTETEPRYDDNEREAWIALQEYENDLCPKCGLRRSICSNPDTPYYPQRSVCYTMAAQEVIERRWRERHEDAKPDPAGYLPTDGAWVWPALEDLTPDDHFI